MQPRSEGHGGAVHSHSRGRGSASFLKPWLALRDALDALAVVLRFLRVEAQDPERNKEPFSTVSHINRQHLLLSESAVLIPIPSDSIVINGDCYCHGVCNYQSLGGASLHCPHLRVC